eukprot:TRINITY_DN16006_c0_g1_i4.p1 TRINITY_DN16006_c0_g1~~TRINITY_DN16006_c0_g1_i4.p1  ORF type:complete len:306 (+),score=42.19 TRINITY_DN16006_c0_g1_i4:162-1079(+)
MYNSRQGVYNPLHNPEEYKSLRKMFPTKNMHYKRHFNIGFGMIDTSNTELLNHLQRAQPKESLTLEGTKHEIETSSSVKIKPKGGSRLERIKCARRRIMLSAQKPSSCHKPIEDTLNKEINEFDSPIKIDLKLSKLCNEAIGLENGRKGEKNEKKAEKKKRRLNVPPARDHQSVNNHYETDCRPSCKIVDWIDKASKEKAERKQQYKNYLDFQLQLKKDQVEYSKYCEEKVSEIHKKKDKRLKEIECELAQDKIILKAKLALIYNKQVAERKRKPKSRNNTVIQAATDIWGREQQKYYQVILYYA